MESTTCNSTVCVHYLDPANNAGATFSGYTAAPSFASSIRDFATQVLGVYDASGYRSPKPDGTDGGGNNLFDIYLTDLGHHSLYGYCTSDDPNTDDNSTYTYYDASAFCAIDNDFSAAEFPDHTPGENAAVTLVHELFHAVQFSYDFDEDSWIMEATATWMEEQLLTDINDNRQYLVNSPVVTPTRSIDKLSTDLWQYGDWIFFEYLATQSGLNDTQGGLPKLVLDLWTQLDGSPAVTQAVADADNHSSMIGLRAVLTARGYDLPRGLVRFGALNRRPSMAYPEGSAYPHSNPVKSYYLSTTATSTGTQARTINHMATNTLRLVPSQLSASNWRVKVAVAMPKGASASSGAGVLIYYRSGAVKYYSIPLNSYGKGVKTLPFSTSTVRSVELTLANASTRYSCWYPDAETPFACNGIPLYDGKKSTFVASVYQN